MCTRNIAHTMTSIWKVCCNVLNNHRKYLYNVHVSDYPAQTSIAVSFEMQFISFVLKINVDCL